MEKLYLYSKQKLSEIESLQDTLKKQNLSESELKEIAVRLHELSESLKQAIKSMI